MNDTSDTPGHPGHHLHLPEERLKTESLGAKLKAITDSLPPDGVTLAEIRDLVGQDGLLILTALLTIVFMVPVSIPGVSTVFGAAILLIGGRATDAWGHLLGCATVIGSFICGVALFSHLLGLPAEDRVVREVLTRCGRGRGRTHLVAGRAGISLTSAAR
jgi:hypothetical protein